MITLGIETSCDETALALIETQENKNGIECRVIDSLVHSQAELHSAYGGVYPNLAKREHGKNLIPLLHKLLISSDDALKEIRDKIKDDDAKSKVDEKEYSSILNGFKLELEAQNPDLWQSFSGADFLKEVPSIDRIAVTEGPGLEPTLWVGINFARILGALWNVPIIPINHMEGHIVGSLLESDTARGAWQRLKPIEFPAIGLLISGGHTELVKVENTLKDYTSNSNGNPNQLHSFKYEILGQTLDDAVGEAFDKVARLLGLPYPGGPHISKLSEEAEAMMTPSPVKLPRPMLNSGNLNFSFSGLKTAVLYATRNATQPDGTISSEFKRGLAHEFELAVTDTLDHKLRQAIDETGARTIIIGGGVSANKMLRDRFTKTAHEHDIPIYLPSRHISGDNALMIAIAGSMFSDSSRIGAILKADGTKRLGA